MLFNCEKDFSALRVFPVESPWRLKIEVENVGVTDVWLRLSVSNSVITGNYLIKRDSIEIFFGAFNQRDTLIHDLNLLPVHEYSYIAYLVENSLTIDSSETITVTTGNFSWAPLGLDGKLVNQLVLHEDTLYACAGNEGLYRLDLNAPTNHWEYLGFADSTVPRQLESGVKDVLVFDNFMLLAYAAFHQVGLYRSLDRGQTWNRSDSGMVTPYLQYPVPVRRLTVNPNNENIILAGCSNDYVFKSIDSGKNWVKVFGGGGGAPKAAITYNEKYSDEIWAGGETGRFDAFLIHSTDGGENWDLVVPLPPLGPYGRENAVYDIIVDPIDDNVIYLGMLGLIMKTRDNGQTGEKILGWEDGIYRNWRLAINPDNPKEILATGSRLYRTTNKGTNWQKILPPDNRIALYALAVDWNKRVLYVSTSSPENGIYQLRF